MTVTHHLEASMHHTSTCQAASHLACTHPVAMALIVPLVILAAIGPFLAMAVLEARKARRAGLTLNQYLSTTTTGR